MEEGQITNNEQEKGLVAFEAEQDKRWALLDQKLDSFFARNNCDNAEIKGHLAKLNGSVINLKAWRSFCTGGMAVIMAILIPMALVVFSKMIER
jgi:hypothetical protein